MIGMLKGMVHEIENDHVLLNVQDVCYIIYCSKNTTRTLQCGECVYIKQQLREDSVQLFDFTKKTKRKYFSY